jgi:Flp pilus assembly protein CpaB
MTLTYRLRNIVIALVFATLAVGITIAYSSNSKSRANAQVQNVSVLVATRDVPVGTPGTELVENGYAKLALVPRSARVPDAVSGVDDVNGLSVSQQINAGEQITSRRFASSAAHGVQAQLTGTQRAVQLSGDADQVLAGTLEAGEHVDVVASLSYPEGTSTHVTRVVARNLLVLQTDSKASGKIASGGSIAVLLAMTDRESQAVFHVVKHGDWALVLRPVTDAANSTPSIDSTTSVLADHGRIPSAGR